MILPTHNLVQPIQPIPSIALTWIGACRARLWVDQFQPSGVEPAIVTRFPIVETPLLGYSLNRYASTNNPLAIIGRYAIIVTSNISVAIPTCANSIDIQPKRVVTPSTAGWAVGTSISTSPRDKTTETLTNKSTKSTSSDTRSALPNVLCGNALKLARVNMTRVGWLK